MKHQTEPLSSFLAEPTRIGAEISITGKWVPATAGGMFRKSTDAEQMSQEWEDIHAGAKAHPGVLSTEINHAVGGTLSWCTTCSRTRMPSSTTSLRPLPSTWRRSRRSPGPTFT